MAERRSRKNTFTIYDDHTTGTVQIADEVISIIAALAATEVEGVASLAGLTHEKAARASSKALSRGVRLEIEEGVASVSLTLNVCFGCSIPDVTKKVQERVKSAIENMTGLQVADVNISVAEVVMA